MRSRNIYPQFSSGIPGFGLCCGTVAWYTWIPSPQTINKNKNKKKNQDHWKHDTSYTANSESQETKGNSLQVAALLQISAGLKTTHSGVTANIGLYHWQTCEARCRPHMSWAWSIWLYGRNPWGKDDWSIKACFKGKLWEFPRLPRGKPCSSKEGTRSKKCICCNKLRDLMYRI